MPRGKFDYAAANAKRRATLAAKKAAAKTADDPFGFPDEPAAQKPVPKKIAALPSIQEALNRIEPAEAQAPAHAETPYDGARGDNDRMLMNMLVELSRLNTHFSSQELRSESDEDRLSRLVQVHETWSKAKHLFSGNPDERDYMEYCEKKRKSAAVSVRNAVRDMMKTDAQGTVAKRH